jgi:RNA polymerase sigma-70 factor (ECF subfamily)
MDQGNQGINSLVERYGERVFNLAFRITGNRQDAEDVTQETFLRVFQGLDGFRGDCSISTWIHRIALNASLAVKRKLDASYLESLDEKIEVFREDIPSEVQEWFDDPAQSMYLQAILDEVNQGCLHFMTFRLTDEQRIPYVMYATLRFSYREIADALEVSEGVVKSRIHRAHAALEKYFRGRCQWLNPSHPSCTCKSRVGFALAFDPELLGRVRIKARATPSDPALIEYFQGQMKEITERYGGLPHLAWKTEALKRYLGELARKTPTTP